MDSHPNTEAQAVLTFWLQDALELGWPSKDLGDLWFKGGAALDREIDTRFGHLVRAAVAGDLTQWESAPQARLALVLLLDQFTRNVFRGRPTAFSGDARAQRLAHDALARGWDHDLPLAGRVFQLMPLEHSEDIALQEECVRRLDALRNNETPPHAEALRSFVQSAVQHRNIIARFGRFPHRNTVLGREATPDERVFLERGPRFGQ